MKPIYMDLATPTLVAWLVGSIILENLKLRREFELDINCSQI